MTLSANCKRIVDIGNRLFADRQGLMGLWQTQADNFYPERADFTGARYLGKEFADHLSTSVPVLARRDLANSISSMLRPRGRPWFYARTLDDDLNKMPGARRWMDHASDVMRRIMYDTRAKFVRAVKEADNDFVTFGQAVIYADLNRHRDGMIFRTFHLRDVVWCENEALEIDQVHRNFDLTAQQLVDKFGEDKVHARVKEALKDTPHRKVKCRHVVLPAAMYEIEGRKDSPYRRKLPFVSLYIDVDNETVLEEVPVKRTGYIIPRWQTVSGSQYAHSPATVVALSDARMLQAITLTLLEAGEKAVDPPMLAVGEAIQGGVNAYAGGVTWIDAAYDERLGEVLRPISDKHDALNWGVDREERIARLIQSAFYLDQIHLPNADPGEKMTAAETRYRYEEYMRRALPLFEPMESDYNGALCDLVFDIGMDHGAFGSPQDIPPELKGQEIRFQFESPIQQAATRANAQSFQESAQLLAIAAQIDPAAVHIFDVKTGLRDALEGVGAPANWVFDEEHAAQITADADEAAGAQQDLMAAQQVAEVVQKGGAGLKSVAGAAHEGAKAGQVEQGGPGGEGVASKRAMARAKTPNPIQDAMAALAGE